MFLKKNRRKKNGRTFTYYSIVENKRCAGGKTVQRQVLYLGELNGTQLEAWRKSIEVSDEDAGAQSELALYPESGAPAEIGPDTAVEIRLGELSLHRPRQWGACWIALHFWDMLRLDGFFGPRLGLSRKGTDCLQVVIALVVTPDGLPIGYEVMSGNTADNSTLRDFLEKIENQYGKAERVWVMDRGIPTEEVLAEMRASDPPVRYLVGTPKGRLTKLEKSFAGQAWEDVREGVQVKLHRVPEEGAGTGGAPPAGPGAAELYILAKSENRIQKERSMRRRKLRKLRDRLGEIKRMKKLTHKECLMKLGAARKDAGRAWHLVEVVPAGEPQDATAFTYRLRRDAVRRVHHREGRYLLRSNLDAETNSPSELWKYYIQLVEIEEAFRNLKGDLGVRPIFHQKESRIEAHIFVSFLAYCLHVTMRQKLKALATGLTPRELLAKFSAIQMLDVHLPTTDGRTVEMSRYTQPDKDQKLLLSQLKLELPAQPPPKIHGRATTD